MWGRRCRRQILSALLCYIQAQLAEERSRRGALEAEARAARQAVSIQQARSRADEERLHERLRAAEQAAEASETIATDAKAQLHVQSFILPGLS